MGKRQPWEGGYFVRTKTGRHAYVIEREVGGRRYHRSTRRSTRRGALEELERFEANPAAYKPTAIEQLDALTLDEKLVDAFSSWQTAKGCTPRHVYQTAKYLADWAEDLAGLDLRHLTLAEHIDPVLQDRKSPGKRIAAIKVFFSFLRSKEGGRRLKTAEDCTLDLLVPQAVPEKRRKKKAVQQELVAKVLDVLPDRYRDVLLFMACTGWHISEVQRFAREDRSELVELTTEQAARDGCIAVAKTWHKGKVWTVTPIITTEHLEAAKRIRARGHFPRTFNAELKRVAIELGGDKKTGAPYYFPLGVMRHSFSTWHVGRGADAKRVSVALNHKDERTTTNFYVDVNVPRSDLPAIEFADRGTLH